MLVSPRPCLAGSSTWVTSGPKMRPTPRAVLERRPGSATGSLQRTSAATTEEPRPLGSTPPFTALRRSCTTSLVGFSQDLCASVNGELSRLRSSLCPYSTPLLHSFFWRYAAVMHDGQSVSRVCGYCSLTTRREGNMWGSTPPPWIPGWGLYWLSAWDCSACASWAAPARLLSGALPAELAA